MRRDVFSVDDAPPAQTESAKTPPKHDDRGAVVAHWVRCGRQWCRCTQGGPKHGPYYFRCWREEGRRHKSYVRQQDAARVASACADRRESERAERARADEAHQAWRDIRALIKEIEHGER
jgi:hypothetical protein